MRSMGRAHSVELALYGGLMGLCPAAVLAFFGYMFATSACHAMPQPCLLKSLSFPCAQQHSHSHPLQDMLRAGLQPASQSTADREHFVEQHCVLLSAAMPCSNRQHRSRSSLAWAFQCVSGSILPPQNDAAFQSKHSTQRLLSHPKSSCLNVDFTKMSVPILLQHDLVSLTFHETHPALGPGTHPARRDFSLRSATSLLRCHRKDHPQSDSTPPTPPHDPSIARPAAVC